MNKEMCKAMENARKLISPEASRRSTALILKSNFQNYKLINVRF